MMNDTGYALDNPLQYQNHLRFPRDLERAYREDYANRAIPTQRLFIVFSIVVYGLFGILDYFAMPQTHQAAWRLRALVEPFAILLFVGSFYRFFQIGMCWLINLWMLIMNLTILAMITISRSGELAFTFYPIGLMLVLISGYISSGHLWYSSLQGWLAIVGYIFVGIAHHRMLVTPQTTLQFFTINFFLVGLNIIGMMLGYGLERINRLAFFTASGDRTATQRNEGITNGIGTPLTQCFACFYCRAPQTRRGNRGLFRSGQHPLRGH